MRNYLDLKKSGELSPEHYQLLSWLGYCDWMFEVHKLDSYRVSALAYSNACTIAGVSYEFKFDVHCNQNRTGLQNFNRLSEFAVIA